MRHPSAKNDAVLATPDELRDRLRQLGKTVPRKDDPRLPRLRAILSEVGAQPGPLLPVLHAVQEAFGCVPPELVGEIAETLNLTRAEVHGVVTYYHFFRSEPAGRHVLEVCRAESCQSMGSEGLWHHACESLGLPATGGTTVDGALTLQPVYCLGLCAQSPAVALDERPHARIDPRRLETLLARAQEAA